MKLLFLFAMNVEAGPTIDGLQLIGPEELPSLPFRIYRGKTERDDDIVLLTSGVDPAYGVDNTGIVSAAAMLTAALFLFGKPDVVVNAGTAGGFAAAGSKIGDVYLGEDYVYHDHRIPIVGTDWPKKGIGGYRMEMPEKLKAMFPTATVTTGNSLDITVDEKALMLKLAQSCPLVKEMEAAAIAEICTGAGLPFIALKSITDIIDGNEVTGVEFMRNLEIASLRLQEALHELLKYLYPELVRQIRPGRNRDLTDKVLRLAEN
ncbi:MAG TPA: hypothetical protein VLH84_00885 [Patescibacteria group bacterium]|nr:hypothetical protein [Patescibacteria group bacterium]